MKHKLIIPTVHLGGTDRETLLAARQKLSAALYESGRALGLSFIEIFDETGEFVGNL